MIQSLYHGKGYDKNPDSDKCNKLYAKQSKLLYSVYYSSIAALETIEAVCNFTGIDKWDLNDSGIQDIDIFTVNGLKPETCYN